MQTFIIRAKRKGTTDEYETIQQSVVAVDGNEAVRKFLDMHEEVRFRYVDVFSEVTYNRLNTIYETFCSKYNINRPTPVGAVYEDVCLRFRFNNRNMEETITKSGNWVYEVCLEEAEIMGSGSTYSRIKHTTSEKEAFELLKDGRNYLERSRIENGKRKVQYYEDDKWIDE